MGRFVESEDHSQTRRKPRPGHPLKHLLLISMLFGPALPVPSRTGQAQPSGNPTFGRGGRGTVRPAWLRWRHGAAWRWHVPGLFAFSGLQPDAQADRSGRRATLPADYGAGGRRASLSRMREGRDPGEEGQQRPVLRLLTLPGRLQGHRQHSQALTYDFMAVPHTQS